MILGEFAHTLDDKGRIAIPAKFRGEFSDGLVVTKGVERCLLAWPLKEWQSMSQKLADLSFLDENARKMQRLFFSGATDCAPDRLGRILLPAFLRQYAQLTGEVMVVGLQTRIEMWSPPLWNLEQVETEGRSAALAQALSVLGIGGTR